MDVTDEQEYVDPLVATEALREALLKSGLVLPSLRVDAGSPQLGLVELGRVRAPVVMRLAEVIQRGQQ